MNTDPTNPNTERFRKTPSDETVEGCLGASSAGQGEVTPSALAPTQPLDLAAIKSDAEASLNNDPRFPDGGFGVYLNTTVLALIARLEQLDGEHDEWRSEIGRLTRERDEWESNTTEESAHAEAAEARAKEAHESRLVALERAARNHVRAEASEAKIAAVRELAEETTLGRHGDYGAPIVYSADVLAALEGWA